jgi:phage tail-like protein
MTLVTDRCYDFQTADQWAAGARNNLVLQGHSLVVPPRLRVEAVPGAGRADAGALPAVDPGGRRLWLRPGLRQLFRSAPDAVFGRGVLSGGVPAQRMVVARTVIWLLAGGSLDRYDGATLQRLTRADRCPGWQISDVAGDGGDGVWVAERHSSGRWRLRHVDCWGRTCRDPIDVTGVDAAELSVATTSGGTRLVVLDPTAAASARVLDADSGRVRLEIPLDESHQRGRTLVTGAASVRIHLLTGLPDRRVAVYESIDVSDGGVEDHEELPVPRRLGNPVALSGDLLACSRGLAWITPRSGTTDERCSTFITPALVSPVGTRSGWNRAELDVVLPIGTALTVDWAATDNLWLIDQATRLIESRATAGLTDELDRLLPWVENGVTYRGTGNDAEHVAALLSDVPESTLWLRVRLQTPPDRTPPQIRRLRVRYPDTTYLDDLPALYREDTRSSGQLRAILAPYELLLDGLDEVLAALPGRIDPATAGDDWTDYLLGWLGFPPLGDLAADSRRDLLEHAPDILRLRGTRRGLELLLDVVTGGRATVTDVADQPAAWFLGQADASAAGAVPARLGRDTLALAQRPSPSTAGGLVLGQTPLGRGCPDPVFILGLRSSVVTITMDADASERETLRPILDRLLPFVVPAHCRVTIVFTGADGAGRSRQLDVDFRLGPDSLAGDPPRDSLLYSDAHWRLGGTARLGRWVLAEPALRPAVLDQGPALGTGPRLR